MASKLDISVIICTYNGSRTIIRCLDALISQETRLNYEIIVIDNNSNDGTGILVQEFRITKNIINLEVITEEVPGKVNALKKGILRSRGEILIICDDDNYLSKDYLNVAYDFFKVNPQCGGACGINTAISNAIFPEWFKDHEILFGCGALSDKTEVVSNLWGAGMVLRGNIVRKLYSNGIKHFLGTMYQDSNRYNSIRLCGEDNEQCFWIKQLGYQLYFLKELKLDHDIPKERLTIQYRDNLIEGIKLSNTTFRENYGILKSALKKPRKKDYLNLFLPTKAGEISRLKLGITKRGKLFNNYKILKDLTK